MSHIADYILKNHPNPNLTLGQLYSSGKPSPNIVLDKFVPERIAHELHRESNNIPEEYWTTFTRNGSHMKECRKLNHMAFARRFIEEMNSSQMLTWLEDLTGIQGLIPDPHLTGAGYSKSFNGDTLKIHNDFNWNDQLRLHRAVSFILYITPGWRPEYNGGLRFYNETQQQVIKTVDCLFNRAMIWSYTPTNYHGYTDPIQCPSNMSRNTIRLFYYTSNSTYRNDDLPHRSQYWFDSDTGAAYDKRDEP